MVRPSRIARKARRAHEQQQEKLRKLNQPTCEGCDHCSETRTRNAQKVQKAQKAAQQKPKPSVRNENKEQILLKDKVFRGVVIIDPRPIALAIAAKEVDIYSTERLVYWTDGSRMLNSWCGIGIAYQSSTDMWTNFSWRLRDCAQPYTLEVYAIAKALEISLEHCCKAEAGGKQKPSAVVIYSDCPPALGFFARSQLNLSKLETLEHGKELVGLGIIASEQLKTLNIEVELR